MTNVIKVGKMPGVISEVVVEEGTSIQEVLSLAGLDASGYEVKVDGTTVTDLDGTSTTSSTGLVILAQQVKGNSGTVKIGKMPGVISEYALEPGTTYKQALEMAGLDSAGYEVKVDGQTVVNLDESADGAGLIILAQQVKGNK